MKPFNLRVIAMLALITSTIIVPIGSAEALGVKDTGLQLSDNPPMQVVTTNPPPPVTDIPIGLRVGFTLISTLDDFRAAIKRDGQRIRLKPGIYRADSVDPPSVSPEVHTAPGPDGRIVHGEQQHVFLVSGSNNYFDLRGVVIETPVSVERKLSMKAHVSNSWDIAGANNTFEGGYFRNVMDLPYPA